MCSFGSGYLRFKYFLKRYKYDLITAISALALWLISDIVPSFKENQLSLTVLKIKIVITLSSVLKIVIALLSIFIISYLRTRDKDFYFISLTQRKHKDDWMGKGNFEYERTHNCFSITKSESGYIYSKCLTWSDYEFSFKFKIIKDCIGVIVRAVNLSNYVMLQIRQNGIRPHIRINGGWKPWEPNEANMVFTESLSLDKWYMCILSCDKGSVNIKLLYNNHPIFERQWSIPEGNLIFQFKKEDEKDKSIDIPFPINLEYGSIGFRNSGNEKAFVKDVLIQKI